MDGPSRRSRSLSFAGRLAIAWGTLGAIAGVVGAATFVPYRDIGGLSLSLSEGLTAISAVGALVSVLGIIAGRRLLGGRRGGWTQCVVVVFASVASVAAMAVVWPASAPIVGQAVFFYGIEALLLLVGLGSYRIRSVRPSPG